MNPFRWFVCLFQMCPFVMKEDDGACWGECTVCGKRAGYITRAELRRSLDRMTYASRAANDG
jgi:hypothetical protein